MCLSEEHSNEEAHFTFITFFSREMRQASALGSGPVNAEVKWRMLSWGSQVELAEKFEKGMDLSHSSAADSSELLDQKVLSLASSNPADSALLLLVRKNRM